MKPDPSVRGLKLRCGYESAEEKVTVIPRIEAESPEDEILIASFHIDSLEMAPSARLVFTKETFSATFPEHPVIYRPLYWFPRNVGMPAFYNFKATFFQDGREIFSLFHKEGFSLAGASSNANGYELTIQQKPLRLQVLSPIVNDPAGLKEEIKKEKKGNFFLLPEEGGMAVWEPLLEICDIYGIAAALPLQDHRAVSLPAELFHHPSLLFLLSGSLAAGEMEEYPIHPLRKSVVLPLSALPVT